MARRYTLVVIDMQSFGAVVYCLKQVRAQIKQAAKDGMPVIFVEYVGWGPTVKEVTSFTGITNKYRAYKNRADGSISVDGLIKNCSLPKNLKLCGVELDCCVYRTALGLSNKGYEVSVITSACANPCPTVQSSRKRRYLEKKNVKLVA